MAHADVQRVHVNNPMSEPGFRAPHSGHGGNAHANMYAYLENISRGMMSHLGLPSSVTNGEDDRRRTSVSAEEQLAPALRDLDLVVRRQPSGPLRLTWTME
jgi:hypothetical protein